MHGIPFPDGYGRAFRLACLAGVWWPLMACQPTAPAGPSPSTASASGADRNDKSAQEHLYRVNPSPKQGFEVVFEVHDAPGPFNDFGGNAHYQSFDCNYVTSEWAGTRSQPTKSMPIEVSRVDATHYRTTFFRDALLDEDYYGKGICHWSLIGVTVGFRATDSAEDTEYAFELSKEAFRDEGKDKQYYWKGRYPRVKRVAPDIPASAGGVRKLEELRPGFRENVFFITAQVKAKP